jgi:hypothetical protein
MGDHNVLAGRVTSLADGTVTFEVPGGAAFRAPAEEGLEPGAPVEIAVRTDRVRLADMVMPGCGLTGLVQNIEYHGQKVQLGAVRPRCRRVLGAGAGDRLFRDAAECRRCRAARLDAAGRPHPQTLARRLSADRRKTATRPSGEQS